MTSEAQFPEHEKQRKIVEDSQKLGEFLEFGLAEQGLTLCDRDDESYTDTRWWPTAKSIQRILADYFQIDLAKLDEEKRAMLDQIRAENAAARD